MVMTNVSVLISIMVITSILMMNLGDLGDLHQRAETVWLMKTLVQHLIGDFQNLIGDKILMINLETWS